MIKIILIIIMGICAVLVIALLVALAKNFLSNMNGKSAFIALIILLAIIGALAFFAFAPRGADSIFSSDVDGATDGNAESDAKLEDKKKGVEMGFDLDDALTGNEAGDNTVYVKVSEDRISIGNRAFASGEEFEEAINSVKNEAREICLLDDYAFADKYKEAEMILKDCGINYIVKSVD